MTLLARLRSDFGVTYIPPNRIVSYLSDSSFFFRISQSSVPVTRPAAVSHDIYSTNQPAISWLINSYGISYHKYTDDMQLYTGSSNHLKTTFESCITGLLGEQPSPELGQIRGLFLWYRIVIVKNADTTICYSCRFPHQSVKQTKDT